jgi:protein-S-isoprenylcysteine O-methyltransferase Ste14
VVALANHLLGEVQSAPFQTAGHASAGGNAASLAVLEKEKDQLTKRLAIFVFGVLSYLAFLLTVLYGIGFVGNLLVPKSIDGGNAASPAVAVLIDLSLIALFGVQHSVMARPGFKQWLTRHVHVSIERSVYVLFSSLCLALLYWLWLPVGAAVWHVSVVPLVLLLTILFWAGWVMIVLSSFLINHFDLFGLRQVTLYLLGIAYTPVPFKQPVVYRYVRHPLMLGFLVAFWATPRMSMGHLLFAAGMTLYILIGIWFEERDLLRSLGAEFQRYRKQVPALFPWRRNK